MNYINFNAGGKEYKLRLSTRSILLLEEKLGFNPLLIFGDGDARNIPTVTNMLYVLYAALQQHHNSTLDEAADIFDAWMLEGNTPPEFLPIIIKIYQAAGLIKNTEKN